MYRTTIQENEEGRGLLQEQVRLVCTRLHIHTPSRIYGCLLLNMILDTGWVWCLVPDTPTVLRHLTRRLNAI